MPLTPEQFQKAKDAGFSTDQIIGFEKRRMSEGGVATQEKPATESTLKPASQFNKVDRIANYFLPQDFSGQKYGPGEQNIYGDILSRPGAAIRGAIFPNPGESRIEGYKRAAMLPESQPSAKESLYLKSGIQPTGNKAADFVKAFPSAFAGEAIDVATQPANYAGGIIGKFLGESQIPKEAGRMVGQAGRVMKTTTQEIMDSPLVETAKRGFVNAVENFKSLGSKLPKVMNKEWLLGQSEKTFQVADDTVKSIQSEYEDLYKGIGKIEVNKARLKEVIYNTMKGATKEEADDILNKLKTELAPQSMGSYELSPNLDTVQKIKTLLQKDIPESVWMKGKKGFDLTPAQSRKISAYYQLKQITKDALAGTEEGSYLEYLDGKATNTYRLTKAIKRMVIDQTGQPAETGKLIRAFSGKAEQAGKENWFHQLKALNENAQEIITNMNKFRQRQAIKKVSATITSGYATYELGKKIFKH